MTERELLQKLHNLRNISPDADWQKSQRDILYTQIANSSTRELSSWANVIIVFKNSVKTFSQPVVAFASFLFILLIGAMFGHGLLNQTKPTDSLYIARVIAEKAKLNTILNSEAREKMELKFAAQHAQDITVALADPSINNNDNQEEVTKLNEEFKRELNTVKTSIDRRVAAQVAAKPEEIKVDPVVATSDAAVFVADSAKDEQGTEIYQSPIGTSTPDTKKQEVLKEAESLFEKKDYNQALNKLKEVDSLINAAQ